MSNDKESDDFINVFIKVDNDEIEIVDEDHNSAYNSEDNANHYLINEDDRKSPVVINCFLDEDIKNEESEENSDSEDTDKDKEDEIVEHVCKKCGMEYSNWKRLMTHLKFCRTITNVEERNARRKFIADIQKNIKKIEVEAMKMEGKGICFCCEENFETCHSGHIRCYECPKSFKNSRSFNRHVFLMHAGTEEYPCQTCNVRCPTERILKIHENSHIRGKPYACKKCGKEFTRRYHLFRHQKFSSCDSTEPKEEVMCKVCRKTFYRVDNLRNHLRQHLDDGPKRRDYPCPHCDKSFYGTATLNIHIRSHTGEKPFPCDICEKCFPSNAALRKHRRSHTGEKPYECSLCKKSFAAKEVLNRHMKTHTGERPHACDICKKSFIQATQLRNHNSTHHNMDKFSCKFCSEKCISRNELQNHMTLKHEKECAVNTCEICKETFQTLGGMRRHFSRIHKNPRASSVSPTGQLKKQFCKNTNDSTSSPVEAFQIRVLQKKKGSLENIKESFPNGFVCDLCPGKKFTSRNGLKKHMTRMHKAIPYACDVCENVFPTNVDLTFHKLQHDDQVYKCKYCDKESKSLKLLEGHIELAHSECEIEQFETEQEIVNAGEEIEEYIIQEEVDIIDEQVDYKSNENTDKDNQSKLAEYSDEADHVLMDIDDGDDLDLTMDEDTLTKNVKELLSLLIDQEILSKFGWPYAKVDKVLEEVIKSCGHTPTGFDRPMDYATKMREYVKLWFTVVIDNDSIKLLLNNHSIDEVIMQVLKMANCNKKK